MCNPSGDIMKSYENSGRYTLIRRIPSVIKINLQSPKAFTKEFEKPYDTVMYRSMQATLKYLCENIQCCVFGYAQPEEITLLLCDYRKTNSSQWLDGNIQKICSISASMATLSFNDAFEKIGLALSDMKFFSGGEQSELLSQYGFTEDEKHIQPDKYFKKFRKAMFEAKTFNIPREELKNYFCWKKAESPTGSFCMRSPDNLKKWVFSDTIDPEYINEFTSSEA